MMDDPASVAGPGGLTDREVRVEPRAPPRFRVDFVAWSQVAPLAAVLIGFLLLPMLAIVVVSFFDYTSVQIIPAFEFTNYSDVLGSAVTWRTYLNTIRFTLIVWAVTVVLGFTVAYVLAFEIRSRVAQMVLFLVCTVPFLTSNIIRMISWIPLLGKEGLINGTLIKLHLIHQPLEFLLFSSFAVVVAYVHQLTIFMIVPIFNAMSRIDKRIVEAALDAGASRLDIMRLIVLPLSKNGIALGTIFVVSIVMGDFYVVKVMSGGGAASVVGAFYEDIGVLQYPSAAASAVLLTVIVVATIALILRTVDVRKEIAG